MIPEALSVAFEAIYLIYDKLCRYVDSHSQPGEHLNMILAAEELEKDAKAVLKAVSAYKAALQ